MRHLVVGLSCIALMIGSAAESQRRVTAKPAKPSAARARPAGTIKPMDALASTVLAFTPDSGVEGSPTLASLRAKKTSIRWLATPKATSASTWKVGDLADGDVSIPQTNTPPEISFEWGAPPGHPLGFNPIKSFVAKGVKVQSLYCSPMVSDGTNHFLLTKAGKRPGVLAIYAFDAPTAASSVSWTITYRLDGKIRSLREVQAEGDEAATADCSSQTFGPVEQISYSQAVATTRKTGGTPIISPLMVTADSALPEDYRTGVFRFTAPSKKICSALYDSAAPVIASARGSRNWIKLANDTMGAGCGADVAYYLLGEAAERIGYRAAALSYYQEASRIASTASFRFSEHCTLNKGGTGFQSAGQGCFGVPIEAASRDAAARMQTVAMSEGSTQLPSSASLGAVEYEGAIDAGFTTAQQQLQLQVGPQQIVGRLKSQMGVLAGNVPVTGTYSNGRCSVQLRGGEDMVGTCDREVFTGFFVQRKTGKQLKKFWFATATRWAQGKPTEIFGNGEQPAQTGQIVTATGRARYLIEPGGRCGPDIMLLKGYCFDEAISVLEQDPRKSDITVIAARQPLPLGARIGRGEYLYVQVKRRKEGGYYADKDLHGYSKVQVPQGCMYRGASNEGFIINLAEGRKAAIEVTDYSCG